MANCIEKFSGMVRASLRLHILRTRVFPAWRAGCRIPSGRAACGRAGSARSRPSSVPPLRVSSFADREITSHSATRLTTRPHHGFHPLMSHNSFGHLFRVTTWGESHGPAIGCVIDGTPPNIRFTLADIQAELDRRRPGQSRYTTQRQEADAVRILSGVMPGEAEGEYVSTGTPIALHIDNTDQRSKDYSDIAKRYRPGHADVTYDVKYGIRDYRGGGRSSARETAMRVAAGAIARKVVPGLTVRGALVAIGDVWIDRARWDWAEVSNNPFFCPDAATATRWAELLDGVRKRGSSIGAVVEIVADGVPAGLGAPIYGKLDADIAAGLMSINAVKGVEIGDGFAAAALCGEDNADEMRPGEDGRPDYLSNHAGGILGGISTGQQVIARFAVKPT